MRTPLLALLLAPLFLVQGCTPSPNAPLQHLLDTVEQHLNLAESIALSKWHANQLEGGIDGDEESVVAAAKAQALNLNLDSDRAAEFIRDQFQANKLLQYRALADWLGAGFAPPAQRADVVAQLRPQLDRLHETLLSQLAEFDRNPPEPCLHVLDQAINQRESDWMRVTAFRYAAIRLCLAE